MKRIIITYMYNLLDENLNSFYLFKAGFFCIALFPFSGIAQVVNKGDLKITENTSMSFQSDYQNAPQSKLINDGELYIFQNWDNDGLVGFTENMEGTTFFKGINEQLIEGDEISDFNNVVFDNTSAQVPFYLGTVISVNKKAWFYSGIIEAKSYDGELVFKDNASHEYAGDQSFVRGRVRKLGDSFFEYPVGADVYFRPSVHNSTEQNTLIVEYFLKNSNELYPHASKEEKILDIDNKEYWVVNQNSGTEKVVLSLTINEDTTPSSFMEAPEGYTTGIVRWDEQLQKWISDGGEVSDPSVGGNYQKLVTSQVGGYGVFTIALIKKDIPDSKEKLIIYNGMTPDGDGLNDTFHIKGIDEYPDNTVEIYNRWGVLVYETKGYNESDTMFKGYSEGRATIDSSSLLPTGTYFYILKYKNGDRMIDKSGYLYINTK